MDKTTKGHEIWALNYLDTQMISQLLLPELQQICEDREASLYLLVHLVAENDLYKISRQHIINIQHCKGLLSPLLSWDSMVYINKKKSRNWTNPSYAITCIITYIVKDRNL